jgi:hypothetical protein
LHNFALIAAKFGITAQNKNKTEGNTEKWILSSHFHSTIFSTNRATFTGLFVKGRLLNLEMN